MSSGGTQLILGGDSMLGQHVANELESRGIKYHRSTRRRESVRPGVIEVDLARPELEFNTDYDTVYFLAGITSTQICKNMRVESREINVTNTLSVLSKFDQRSTRIVYPSSNHVFSGETPFVAADSDETPQTYYGQMKKDVERSLINEFSNFTIVRLSKIIPDHFEVFNKWMKCVNRNESLIVKDGESISPVDAILAAKVIVDGLALPKRTLVQLSAPDEISYTEIYEMFLEKFRFKSRPEVKFVRQRASELHGSMKLSGFPESSTLRPKSSRQVIINALHKMKSN